MCVRVGNVVSGNVFLQGDLCACFMYHLELRQMYCVTVHSAEGLVVQYTISIVVQYSDGHKFPSLGI